MAQKQGNQGKMGEGLKINPTTFEIYGANSGKVFGKGANISEANALATQMQSGGTPTVSGRPDLFAVAPTEKTGAFYDKTLQKMVTPTTATPEQIAAVNAGTLESYAKAQGLTYLDGPTFNSLGGKLTSNDLIDIDGRLFLKDGTTLEEVQARKASSTTGAPTNEVSVTQGSTTPEETLNDSLSSPTTNSDLQALLDKNTAAQNEYLATLGASADETAIKTQLADLRAQADEYQQSLQAGLDTISDETIPMAFITGQQASLERRAQRTIANYASLEKNLLERLGIEQEDRKMDQEAAAQKYEFAQGNIDLYFKVQDRIQADEDRIAEKASKLKDEAKSTLADMLEMFQGYDMADLSTEAQGQLATLATSAGIPLSLLSEGMTSMKNSAIADELKPASLDKMASEIFDLVKTGDYTFDEAREMVESVYGTSSSGSTYVTDDGSFDINGYASKIGNGTVTQDFDTPVDYITGRSTHGGYDIDGKIGDSIFAPVSGTIVASEKAAGWGNTIVIEDVQGNRWRMAHFNTLGAKVGDSVSSGQVIGTLGNSGTVFSGGEGDGSHLHLEVKNSSGSLVDPASISISSSPSSGAISFSAFKSLLESEMKQSLTDEVAQTAYEAYQTASSTESSKPSSYLKSLQEDLSATDRQRMLIEGLKVDDEDDILKYLELKFADDTTSIDSLLGEDEEDK